MHNMSSPPLSSGWLTWLDIGLCDSGVLPFTGEVGGLEQGHLGVLYEFSSTGVVSTLISIHTFKQLGHILVSVIRESVDSLCRDGADAQYMQYLSKSRITSPQTR